MTLNSAQNHSKQLDYPRVKIIIVGFDNAQDIHSCLHALSKQTFGEFQIIVVENAGHAACQRLICFLQSDATLSNGRDDPVGNAFIGDLCGGKQHLRIVCPGQNLGFAGGVNFALLPEYERDSQAYYWILNPDTLPDPDALSALVKKINSRNYGIIGARLVLTRSNRIQLYGGRWRRWMAGGYNIGYNQPLEFQPDVSAVEAAMDYVNGACMLVKPEFIRDVGVMRDDYFLYAEEVDWCMRRRDYELGYAHDAIIYHAHGSTIGSSHDRIKRSRLSVFLDERNKLLLTRRFFPFIFPMVSILSLLLVGRYLKCGAFRNALFALQGWWAGIKGEVGAPSFLAK